MIDYNTTPSTSNITRRTVSTVKTYDEEGRLITEETVEDIEYGPVQHPNTPWIVTNAANTGFHGYNNHDHVHVGDIRKSDIDWSGRIITQGSTSRKLATASVLKTDEVNSP